MADMVYWMTNVVGVSEGNVTVNGQAKTSDDHQVDFTVSIPASTGAVGWLAALKAAAIAAVELDGGSVGLLDNKTCLTPPTLT